jgi:ABC-2 type transport system ATP-binding protein
MSDASTPALEFKGLEKEFKLGLGLTRVHAVRGVDLEVGRGEIFGYLGPNGAGKTTSMKMAMGLIQPTAGSVRVLGGDIADRSIRRRIGYLPEHPFFYDYLTAFEILDFYGQLYELPRKARRARIESLLELVGLSYARDRTLRRFSKGMLQRVGIAQALIADPDLVILDEPLSGLDPMGRREVRNIIVSLREQGKTVFFSTHILNDIETICDRVAMIVHGKVVRVGPLAEMLSAESTDVEIVANEVDGGLRERLQSMGVHLEVVGSATRLRLAGEQQGSVMGELMESGAVITHVNPYRVSLEELFVREAAGAGVSDG